MNQTLNFITKVNRQSKPVGIKIQFFLYQTIFLQQVIHWYPIVGEIFWFCISY